MCSKSICQNTQCPHPTQSCTSQRCTSSFCSGTASMQQSDVHMPCLQLPSVGTGTTKLLHRLGNPSAASGGTCCCCPPSTHEPNNWRFCVLLCLLQEALALDKVVTAADQARRDKPAHRHRPILGDVAASGGSAKLLRAKGVVRPAVSQQRMAAGCRQRQQCSMHSHLQPATT